MTMPISALRAYVESHSDLVYRTESKKYPGLFVLKYKRKVFYEGLWNDQLEWCRGLVVDADWNVVIKPFRKIYNRFERDTNFDPAQNVFWARKINGFMAAVTYDPEKSYLLVSTTGSLDSDYVGYAEDMLYQYKSHSEWMNYLSGSLGPARKVTIMCEIVHPLDPHIIDEKPGFYPLAMNFYDDEDETQNLEEGIFVPHVNHGLLSDLGALRVECGVGPFSEVVSMARGCQHEGYVVYDRFNNPRKGLKIKGPYYLVTKFLARKGGVKLLAILNDANWKMNIEEEYFEVVEALRESPVKEMFIAMNERERINWVREWFEKRMAVTA